MTDARSAGCSETGNDGEVFKIIAEECPNMIFINKDGRVVYANKKCVEIMGYSREELQSPAFDFMTLVDAGSRETVVQALEQHRRGRDVPPYEYRLVTKSGDRPEVIITTKLITYDGGPAILGIVTDISAQKRAENALRASEERYRVQEQELKELNLELSDSNRKLKKLAFTDSHTGLYNHRFLGEVIDNEFQNARKKKRALSLVLLDIDYFKSINDVYGHHFGDLVLKQFARSLKTIVGRENTVIRYGGEEFIVLLPAVNRADAVALAQELLEEINLAVFGDRKHTVKLRFSVAVASSPEDRPRTAMDLIELAEQVLSKAKELGGNRVYSQQDLGNPKRCAAGKAGARSDVRYLKEKIGRLHKSANQSLMEAIFAFARTIELKDHYTGEHVERTVYFATRIAEELGLAKESVMLIRQAAILHDLGKVGISEKILLKPAKLSRKEFAEIRKHPLIGVDIIRPIHLFHDIIPLIMYHHERWDGKGYPMGLKGEEIPLGARVVALADTFQALISNRPYRKAYPRREAKKIIKRLSGSQFDPKIVEAFLKIA